MIKIYAVATVSAAILLAGCAASNSKKAIKDAAPMPSWMTSGQILYSNDYAPDAGTSQLPYILGGTDVSSPTQEALERYQKSGNLADMNLSQLEHLYKAEGIVTSIQEAKGGPGLHVLEGGKSLLSPLPGTVGYARLYGQIHSPYQPKSKELKELCKQLAAGKASSAPKLATAQGTTAK